MWRLCLCIPLALWAQPLTNPFAFQPALWEPIESTWWTPPGLPPAADSGWLSIREGDFVDAAGNRQRFVGAVLYFTACFPDSLTAIRVAARLKALGFNAVAFRGIDISNWNAASILRSGTSSTALDPEQMRRLDWFFYQLKRHGIRLYLALHSRWTPRRDDGVPGWDSIPSGGKAVLYTDPHFQWRHRQIVRLLLQHVNPYTGLAYKDDPFVSWVELSEENSLLFSWQRNQLHYPGGILSHYHSRQLDTLFNLFLRRKYGTDGALRAAWSTPPADTQNAIPNGSFEDEFNLRWVFYANSAVAQAIFRITEADRRDGRYAGLIRVAQTNRSPGSVYLYTGTTTAEARLYELRFWARASSNGRRILLQIYNAEFPNQNLGLFIDTVFTTAWQEYRFRFRATDSAPAARLIFYFGVDTGDVLLDAVQLRMLDEVPLRSGESLASFSVARSLYNDLLGTPMPRMRDNVEFYTELQRAYYEGMYRFLRDTLGYRGFIIGGTLLSTLNDLWSMQRMDGTAELAGWDFRRNRTQPQGSWDIANTPMLGHPAAGSLPELAHAALRGKPTVVFYFMPFPSSHMGEMATLIPAYAAYHGWDALFFHYLADSRESYTLPMVGVNKHYELWANSAVTSLLPSASAAYRAGMISTAQEKLPLQQTYRALLHPQWQRGSFWLQYGTDNRIVLFRGVFFDSLTAWRQSVLPHRTIPELNRSPVDISNLRSDTEELHWNAQDTLLIIRTPRYSAITGRLTGILTLGPARFERLDGGPTGTVSWLSLDTLPLETARWSLLTLSSRACNDSALWEGTTSIWQGWGKPPVLLEGMRCRISWRSNADTVRLYGLDSTGRLAFGPFEPTRLPGGWLSITLDQTHLLQRTPWFVLEQSWRDTSTAVAETSPAAMEAILLPPFPNPARGSVQLSFWLPPTGVQAWLEVLSSTGQRQQLWHGTADGTWRSLSLPPLASGAYWLRLVCGASAQRFPLVILP